MCVCASTCMVCLCVMLCVSLCSCVHICVCDMVSVCGVSVCDAVCVSVYVCMRAQMDMPRQAGRRSWRPRSALWLSGPGVSISKAMFVAGFTASPFPDELLGQARKEPVTNAINVQVG